MAPQTPNVAFHTTKNVLTCVMIFIVCFLAATLAVQEFCSFHPSSVREWCCLGAIASLFIVVAWYLCHRTTARAVHDAESFADAYEWGYNASILDSNAGLDVTAAEVPTEGTARVVGPDADRDELITWQYNPQNTLVDYKFYEVHPDQKTGQHRRTQQLAPLTDGRIGKQ
jgi:hypothetical protein